MFEDTQTHLFIGNEAAAVQTHFKVLYSFLIHHLILNHLSFLPPPAHPGSPVRLPVRLSGPGSYRLAIICLATLCAVLLISVIAVTAHCEYMAVIHVDTWWQ